MTQNISVYPLSNEKAYRQSINNVYIFSAPVGANKQQIADAIEEQFKVSVVGIKTLVQFGKTISASRGKRARPGMASRKDTKKAYVTLAKGDSIKVFDEPKDAKKDAKAAKKEKK